jgi:hypothetical protein
LQVREANSFGNLDGMIHLERFLDLDTGRIFNTSQAVARDNSRWVSTHSHGPGWCRANLGRDWWRTDLAYRCPATYYSINPNTGIIVNGDVILRSDTDISNRFSTIFSTTGSFSATARREFENIVGSIVVLGQNPSSITAETITNSCLPAYLRQGGAQASGRCGWGTGRRTWRLYHHTAEWVTQSHGSMMLLGGDTTFIGHTKNVGSSILSRGLFRGDVSSTSVLENIAQHGSLGTLIDGRYVHGHMPQIFVYKE